MVRKPDFNRLKKALFCDGEPDWVPMFEVGIDQGIKNQFLGKQLVTNNDEIEFYYKAGYDYVPVKMGLHTFVGSGSSGKARVQENNEYSLYDNKDTRVWAEEGEGSIKSWNDFNSYSWPDPKKFDYSQFVEISQNLPEGMKIVGFIAKMFTSVWELMGFDNFCYATADNPELVEKVFFRVAETQLETAKEMLKFPSVEALCVNDDIAYIEGPMVSPRILRKYFFPWLRELGDMCFARGIPFIYHSDGDTSSLLEDILSCRVNAHHPFEPKAMDIFQAKQKYENRLCVIGNVDLGETLSLGTPEDVEAEVKNKIRLLAPGGGYCISSSNTITDYVPLENYKRFLATVDRYGAYPIKI